MKVHALPFILVLAAAGTLRADTSAYIDNRTGAEWRLETVGPLPDTLVLQFGPMQAEATPDRTRICQPGESWSGSLPDDCRVTFQVAAIGSQDTEIPFLLSNPGGRSWPVT